MTGAIALTHPGPDPAGFATAPALPEQRAHATVLARDRNTVRRDRSREHLVPGANGKPYAMRLDPDTGALVDDLPHGSESTYCNRLCRCDPCGEANAAGKARRAHGVPSDRSLS